MPLPRGRSGRAAYPAAPAATHAHSTRPPTTHTTNRPAIVTYGAGSSGTWLHSTPTPSEAGAARRGRNPPGGGKVGRRRPHGRRAPYGAYVRVGAPPPDREDADRRARAPAAGGGELARQQQEAPEGGGRAAPERAHPPAAPGAGGGPGKTRGGWRKSRAPASSAPGGCDREEARALAGEGEHDRRATDGHQTSEARPATTTTTAPGPRWISASAKLAAEEGRGGVGGYVGEDEGKVFAVSESNRTAR